jgi:signal transduction histidine kinase/CheY-like chemotaxis protein
MNAGMMRLESVANPEVMERLTDAEISLGMIIGLTGRIYYSSNPDYVGEVVSGVLPEEAVKPDLTADEEIVVRSPDRVTAVVPIMGADGRTARFYAYTVLSTDRFSEARTSIVWMVTLGALCAVVLISVLIFFSLRRLIVGPVRRLTAALHAMHVGDMDTRVEGTMRTAEFRSLADGINGVAAIRGDAERSLREANETKSRFLAGISHELRTPLHGIMGMANLAESEVLSESQHEALASIHNSAEALHNVLRNILDFTVLEAGELELHPTVFDLAKLVRETAASFEALIRSKEIEMETQVEQQVRFLRADRFRVEQLLFNLVSNAVKYTDEGRVIVEARGIHSGVRITVSDTGIGIAPEHRESIFDSFRQLEDPYTKTRRGLGLGLALVKRIAERMGGTISVERPDVAGSVFVLDLPVEVVDAQPPSPTAQGSATFGETTVRSEREGRGHRHSHSHRDAANGRSILVVEDDAINRLYVTSLLSRHGFTVDEAKDGEEAVDKAVSANPKLILMDVGLPKLNGIDATMRIREREGQRSEHVPIVALTAHAYEEDRKRCLQAGMDEFLTKPLNETILLRTIENLTSRA